MYPFEDPSLTVDERVHDLLSRLTTEEKIGFLTTHNSPVERLGIGEWFFGTECARGLVNREPDHPSTVFPQPIGLAATFDRKLLHEIGRTAAREARAYYNQTKNAGLMLWGPTVDLCHDPRWGRTEECYGEEPFLTGKLAGAYTMGLRGEENVWATIPTLKHFCANSHEQDRDRDNANLNPRLKHEYYYAAFKAPIIRGGAHSVMSAYNSICHAPAVMNHDLNDLLKAEWGLGFVVTDAIDFVQNVTSHHAFTSHAQALQGCLRAGADIMTDNDDVVHAAAKKALAEGLVTEDDIDRAIGHLLESRMLLGHFDRETPYDGLTLADVNTDADKALNRRAAQEQMILLKNNGSLPLTPGKHKIIALIGANADCNLMDWYTGYSSYQVSIRKGLAEAGCEVRYEIGWDIVMLQAPNGKYIRIIDDCLYADTDKEHADRFYLCVHDDKYHWVNLRHVETGRFVRMADGAAKLGGTAVYGWLTPETLHLEEYRNGTVISGLEENEQLCLDGQDRITYRKKQRPDDSVLFRIEEYSQSTERIAALVSGADAVIFCGGNDPMQVARECYDRESIALPQHQKRLCGTLSLLTKKEHIPFILTLVSGYPYALDTNTQALPDAILHTTHAGPELGHAVTDTLFGDNNPAGRCPLTWYACDGDLPDKKNYDVTETRSTVRWFDGEPLYPFGHGLSYSSFTYAGMQTSVMEDGIRITADITNTSERDGDEVVQVYAHALSGRICRPLRQLCAFARLHIKAGEAVQFEEIIPFRELEIYDVSRERFCLEDGDYAFMLGASSRDIRCRETVHVPGETVPPRNLTKKIRAELWDSQTGTEIFTDPLTGVTHVRGLAQWNAVTYQNCSFDGVNALHIWASSPMEKTVITVMADHKPIGTISVPACDGYTDFRELVLPLVLQGCHDLTIVIPTEVSLLALEG